MFVTCLALEEEGIKARTISRNIIPIGMRSSIKGGGGNGGRIKGRIKRDAVRPTRTTTDSKRK